MVPTTAIRMAGNRSSRAPVLKPGWDLPFLTQAIAPSRYGTPLANFKSHKSRTSEKEVMKKGLLIGLVIISSISLVSSCAVKGSQHEGIAVPALNSGSSSGYLGDGMCSQSLLADHIQLGALPAGTRPAHPASVAIARTKESYPLLPSDASFSAYPALLTAPNIRLPNPNTPLGAGPILKRIVWVVEVNNLDSPTSSAAVVGRKTSRSLAPVVLHHMLDFVDDQFDLEPFSVTCS